ncbi:hypothetical protein [Sphingomonas sp. M1A8_2b]
MFGLILKYYLYDTLPVGVPVTLLGTFPGLMATRSVNPSSTAATWPRSSIVPIGQHSVTSQFGGAPLDAYICALKTSQFEAAFDEEGGAK